MYNYRRGTEDESSVSAPLASFRCRCRPTMFQELHLTNFKNFREATLELGPFTVLVGANASGKSNLRDAFRFLHGVGRGYDFVGILEEKYSEGSGERAWSGIRGGAGGVAFKNANAFHLAYKSSHPPAAERCKFEMGVEISDRKSTKLTNYEKPRLLYESLEIVSGDRHPRYQAPTENFELDGKDTIPVRLPIKGEETIVQARRDRPIAAQLETGLREGGDDAIIFGNKMMSAAHLARRRMRFLNFDPKALRDPSKTGQRSLGDRGQNLASVLMGLCEDEARKSTLIEWVETLTPMDAKDLEFDVAKHSNEVTLVLVEKDGTKTPMQSASDGTLRFLGLLALLFQDDPPELLFIEEIETGLHPTRLDLLANLIEQRTEQTDTQVIATTHSPLLLQVLDQQTLEDAQLVYRTGDGPDARITPLLQVPTARKVLDKPRQNIRDLHSTGWFERVMAFSGEEAVGP